MQQSYYRLHTYTEHQSPNNYAYPKMCMHHLQEIPC